MVPRHTSPAYLEPDGNEKSATLNNQDIRAMSPFFS